MWHRDRERRKEEAQAATAVESGWVPVDATYLTAAVDQTSDSEMSSAYSPISPSLEPVLTRPGAWKMGLIVTASALCGGIAVVLWNRRLLARMREAVPLTRSAQQGRLWEDDL